MRLRFDRIGKIDQNRTISAVGVIAASVLVAGLAYTMSVGRAKHTPQSVEVGVDPCNNTFNREAEESIERRVKNAINTNFSRLRNEGVIVNVSLAVDRSGRVHLQDFWPIIEGRMHEIRRDITRSVDDVTLTAPPEGSFCTISIPIKLPQQI